MSDLIDTTEMYLRTIYELIEDGVIPMRARIAEQLGHSGPTVSQTIARMERDGLVVVSSDRRLELTEAGLQTAVRVMRKHRLAERLLIDVIGLELAYVHEEACRWEHVMSDRVERRLLELLDTPRFSPYGNPIPALGELGVMDDPDAPRSAEISLDTAADSGIFELTVTRIGENPQAADGFLVEAIQAGLVPGATVHIILEDDAVVVTTLTGSVAVSREAARHLFGHPRLGESSRIGNMGV
ncbi:metal-dependent transcriptional regulator [Demequina aestuarii]|uniref:metal-dependent transcriptional regulator n=1 Tax=Demequina aestuarii TaxID=327095 RepID=UPI000780D001|nr:metal-dependent transcriptional regulator [Demequina aestuarii]